MSLVLSKASIFGLNLFRLKIALLFISFFFFYYSVSIAQPFDKYPKDYFRSPLDIPLFLAGNFAEIRPNHFHGGIDIKTESVEGKNIYATADGYISRIKIKHGGYGKTLYINHPNGYTTVYAHLQKFNDEIEAYVQKKQYQKESYEIDIYLKEGILPISKSEVIALGGNSGGSSGPHLHFEIRDTKTEYPLNPLLFGFNIKDNIKPKIRLVGVYPIDENSTINFSNSSKIFQVIKKEDEYTINENIEVAGNIGFAIEVRDYLNGSNNRCGVYSIELFIDSNKIYRHNLEKVGFHETRYINSLVDYERWNKDGQILQRSFLQPNNKLGIYEQVQNHGIYTVKDTLLHVAKYIITDSYGNQSVLDFNFKGGFPKKIDMTPKKCTTEFKSEEYNSFENEAIIFSIPKNALYEDLCFEYKKSKAKMGSITNWHHIHNVYTPIHRKATISMKIDSIYRKFEEKIVLARIDKKGELDVYGGTVKDGYVTSKTKKLGAYSLLVDSIPPKITPIKFGENMENFDEIKIKITDDLSGIASYRGTIDNNWILMEYDYKTDMLTYYFDNKRVPKGKHAFELTIIDDRNNISKLNKTFIR